jgi:predicted RNA-binding Zn ribbon-like protein
MMKLMVSFEERQKSLEKSASKNFFFIGNHLCLDLINTQIALGGQPVDLLGDFNDLISWFVQASVIDESKAKEVMESRRGEREAFVRALRFRAGLARMVERITKGKAVPQSVIADINDLLGHQSGYAELKRVRGGFEKRLRSGFSEPIQLLWPVAESACDLLCYADLSLIRKCENEECVLVFYDTTRNHSRRWCSMSACGNRMKVAAHYRRLRSTAKSTKGRKALEET